MLAVFQNSYYRTYNCGERVIKLNYKLTIDVNLMDTELNIPAMNTLKRWKEEGKLDLIEADGRGAPKKEVYTWPGAPKSTEPAEKPAWKGGKARSGKMNESGKANFKSVAAVIFPGKDPMKLNLKEINNVAHLIKHHSVKNEIFVAAKESEFITSGRRDLLKSYFGIIVMTPDEAVEALTELQGWGAVPRKTSTAKQKTK